MKQSEKHRLDELFTERALTDILELLDRQKCAEWLFDRIWPGTAGERCPKCRSKLSAAMLRNFRRFRKTRCTACGAQFRAGTGSPFYHVHRSPAEIVLLSALIAADAPVQEITTALRIDRDTVNSWRRRLSGLTLGDARGFADDE